MRNTFATLLTIAFTSLAPKLALAHANLLSPTPRNPIANKTPTTLTVAPGDSCGMNPADGTLTVRAAGQMKAALKPGQQLPINWVETISHTGYFQIWFSPNADDSNMTLLMDNIPNNDRGVAPTNFSATVTIPNVQCADCTLRLIQVMLDNHPAAPTYYYSCANISIGVDEATSPTGTNPTTPAATVPCNSN